MNWRVTLDKEHDFRYGLNETGLDHSTKEALSFFLSSLKCGQDQIPHQAGLIPSLKTYREQRGLFLSENGAGQAPGLGPLLKIEIPNCFSPTVCVYVCVCVSKRL